MLIFKRIREPFNNKLHSIRIELSGQHIVAIAIKTHLNQWKFQRIFSLEPPPTIVNHLSAGFVFAPYIPMYVQPNQPTTTTTNSLTGIAKVPYYNKRDYSNLWQPDDYKPHKELYSMRFNSLKEVKEFLEVEMFPKFL